MHAAATQLDAAPSPEAVVALLADRPGLAWLDGGARGWSIVAWDPSEVATAADGWPAAGRRMGRPRPGEAALPFVSGVLGYVGYDAAAAVAPVPRRDGTWEPPVWLGRYDGALLHDHATGRWVATGPASRRADAARLVGQAAELPPPPPAAERATRTVDAAAYQAAIARVLDWIAEGDHYQLALSRPVFADDVDDAFTIYRRVRARSAAERGAYLRLGPELTVLSNSPETLLEVDGRDLRTEPIKGTRPRRDDDALDGAEVARLAADPKELAELTMIVDLCRNDLGRIAEIGSVRAGARVLTAHANVHHASWPVEARLADGRDPWDALAALFPPGSVVGAPKIRAAHRIAELEPHPRGAYCGAIGFVSDHGRAAWSVAIRTAVVHGRRARWHVGGGLVADSDPAAEWAETIDKGTVLAAAIAGRDEA